MLGAHPLAYPNPSRLPLACVMVAWLCWVTIVPLT